MLRSIPSLIGKKWKDWVSAFLPLPLVLLATSGILILAGLMSRAYVIVHAGSWWFDESLSYSFAKLPILQSWQYLKYENNPPLYFWMLRGWGLLFGFGEMPLRIFSLILGIVAMVAIMRLAAELFGRITGLWTGTIYAVTSLAIFADTEARMYSLLALLAALSYFYFLKILYKKPSWFDVFAYVLVVMLALYTNITALWIPLTQTVIITFIKPKEMVRFRATLLAIFPVLLFSPWLISFALERIAFAKYISFGSWRYFSNGIPWSVFFTEPISFVNFWSVAGGIAEVISLLISLIFISWFLRHAWKRHRAAESKFLVVLHGFLFPLVVSAFTIDLGSSRYYYQSAIFFWIIIAYAITLIGEKIHSKIFLGLLVGGLVCYAFFNIQLAIRYSSHGNWDIASRWIGEQHPNLVLAMPKMWSAEVYDPSLPFYFLPPPVESLRDDPLLSPLQMVTRYNYNWGALDYRMTPDQENFLKGEIEVATAHSSEIVFGYQGSEAEAAILMDLARLGFQRNAAFSVDGYLPETLLSFGRNSY